MAKVLENYKKTNFSSKSQPGACLAVCLIFWPISAWRAYKLRAYKKTRPIAISRVRREQRPTDRPTDRPTEWLIESRARD